MLLWRNATLRKWHARNVIPSVRALSSPDAECRNLNACSGFTLVEMAVVMVIIGLVMLTVFPALNAVRSANQRQLTQSNLRSLMLATASYVQATGCLPCPASPGAVGANFGRMNYAAATTVCGVCTAPQGIPPYVALGIPASTAHDGWGHWITMRVDPALTANFAAAPPTTNKGLCQTGLATSGRIAVTIPGGAAQQAAVIFVSHGANGYGSYFAQAVGNGDNGSIQPFSAEFPSCGTGGYAQCNAAQTAQFYDAAPSNLYDDTLAYADRNMLVAMFGNNNCQTVW